MSAFGGEVLLYGLSVNRPSGASYSTRIALIEEENGRLREEVVRSQRILASAVDFAIITMDLGGYVTSWNLGARHIFGYSKSEMLGRSGAIVFTSQDRAEGQFLAELSRALKYGNAINERWHIRRCGNRFWASGTTVPLLDEGGQAQGFLTILRDRTEARTEIERRELLAAEMNHRIKNTFATVQAVAAQTARYASSPADFLTGFNTRLLALAKSHDMLIRNGCDAAPLREIVEGALAPYGHDADSVTIGGTSVLLGGKLVVTANLAFHELATNAAKHGALSVPGGRVQVGWTVSPASRGTHQVDITWRERGGPAVRLPERRGFGSLLLGGGMLADATVRLDYHPEGVECRMTLPVETGHTASPEFKEDTR